MTFLPIVVRELRVAARRKSVYRTRFWTAFTAISVGSYLILTSSAFMGRTQGGMIFNTLVVICCLSCLSLAGNTSDCISEEKREGTLGFLFLTDLRGYDIALGKLASASLLSFYAILGIFPIVAVSLLLGGVSAREFWQVVLALLNVFFFSHAAGIFMSAFSRKRQTATGRTGLLLMSYTAGLFFLSLGLKGTRFASWNFLIDCFNPGYCVHWACVMGFRQPGSFGAQFNPDWHYWISLLLVHLNAWIFLALASWWLPRCWQEKSGRTRGRWRERLLQWYHARFTPRRPLLDSNPFLWLTVRNTLGSLKIWMVLISLGCFWVWLLSRLKPKDAEVPLLITAIIVNHLILKVFVAAESANNLETQRHNGALEFLLSCTPLSVEKIVQGQWLALRRQFLWPMIAVLIADVVMMIKVIGFIGPMTRDVEIWGYIQFALAVMVMLVPDMFALGWVGMWNAMAQRKPRHAAGSTVSQVLLLPWLIMAGIQALSLFSNSPIIDSFSVAVVLWFIIGIAVDLVAINLDRQRLLTQFRTLAATPIGEHIGFFGKLGRWLGGMANAKP